MARTAKLSRPSLMLRLVGRVAPFCASAPRLAAKPAFDAATASAVTYPGGAGAAIDLDYTKPIRVVYGQNAPVLELESAIVIAGTLILVGTTKSHALIAHVTGVPTTGSFVQRADTAGGGPWVIVGGADSRAVEEAAMDYVLRYWRTAKDSAARRIGLVEKELPRTVDPAKLPDRIR